MKILGKKIICAVLLLLYMSELFAIPPFKTHLDTENTDDQKRCQTASLYDDNTAITFFGDSRIDLVDLLSYGASSLDFYLQSDRSWNVQNFGVAGMQSDGLKDLIRKCLTRTDGNPAVSQYPNFKFAYNTAFEIGGNDFVGIFPLFIINPALYITRVPMARDNIVSIIYQLQMRERKVLLIGNYPALSWSVRLGDPKDYAGWNGFNPKVFDAYRALDPHRPISERDFKYLEQVFKKLTVGSIGGMNFAVNFLGSVFSSLPGYEASDINSLYQGELPEWANGGEEKDIARMAIGSYSWWKAVSTKAIGTVPSVGVVFLENQLRDVYANPAQYGLSPFEYVSTAEHFLYAPAKFEPWVVNPHLMTDIIHKNHLGYAVWGHIVGDKLKQLGWTNEKGVGDSVGSNKADRDLKQALLKLKKRYEDRLSAINGELTQDLENLRINKEARITAATKNISSLSDRVTELERIEYEAEQERLRLLAEAERQRQEAQRLYEQQQEQARLEAQRQQAAWAAQQKELKDKEDARKKAEDAARQRKLEEEFWIGVAACIAFGLCKR